MASASLRGTIAPWRTIMGLYRCGMPFLEAPSPPINVITVLCCQWPGRRIVSVLPLDTMTGLYEYGMPPDGGQEERRFSGFYSLQLLNTRETSEVKFPCFDSVSPRC